MKGVLSAAGNPCGRGWEASCLLRPGSASARRKERLADPQMGAADDGPGRAAEGNVTHPRLNRASAWSGRRRGQRGRRAKTQWCAAGKPTRHPYGIQDGAAAAGEIDGGVAPKRLSFCPRLHGSVAGA